MLTNFLSRRFTSMPNKLFSIPNRMFSIPVRIFSIPIRMFSIPNRMPHLKTFNSLTLSTKNSCPYSTQKLNHPNISLTQKNIFTFSQAQSPSSKIPIIHKLRKQAQLTKLKQGQTNPQHINILHQLTIALISHNYIDEALPVAEQVVRIYSEVYNKTAHKSIAQQGEKILYNRILQSLYKATLQYDKYFDTSFSIIEIYEELLKTQPKIALLVIDLYIEVGNTQFELNQFDQSIKSLQKVINYGEKHKDNFENRFKILETKNMIADIMFHKKNQVQESFKILTQNLEQIKKAFNDKFNLQIVSRCILNLTSIYTIKIPDLSSQETSSYLKNINPFIKQISILLSKNELGLQQLLDFNRNLAQLYLHTKDYNKATQCYRFERDHIKQNQFIALALCYQNQAKIYQTTKKLEKALSKFNKSIETREKIHALYADKKRKTPEQQKILSENKNSMIQVSVKISQLYNQVKNYKHAQVWVLKSQTIQKL